MTLAGSIRSRQFEKGIRERAQFYSSSLTEEERKSLQLELWNVEWQRLLTSVPYYMRLASELSLPSRFRSWQEFVDRVPVTTRATVQKNKREMVNTGRAPDSIGVTGGSTAEPIQVPVWDSEKTFTQFDMWLARSWYGILPGSRLFLLWGHSHLLGSGIKGWINAQKRMLSDRLLGYYRCSAYDLQPMALRRAARELMNFKPDYMIGYSVALDLLARANVNLGDDLRAVGLKVVLGTAESFPSPNSATLLQDLFGCPVAMEYGAVETALIAHTWPAGGYRVFWRTYFVEAERDNTASTGHKVRVSSLYPRCFPLVRYELGDEIELWDPEPRFVMGIDTFKRVIGRCNDYVLLRDGAMMHSEVFTHAVRHCSEITSYQIIQVDTDIHIHFTSPEALSEEKMAQIRSRLAKVHPELAQVRIKRVSRLQQTLAGKTPMVLRR